MKKILVADDEPPMLSLVTSTLEDDDRYQILLANDGDEALKIARQEQPDLIFLDVMMPKKDGFEVCRLLKRDPATARAKIIMLTALTQERDVAMAAQSGADGYFPKPFSPSALLRKVDEVVGAP